MFWYRVDKPFWWKLLCETYQFVRIFSIQGFRLFNRYSIDFWIWPRYYDINMTIFDKVDYLEIEPALFPSDLLLLHRNVYCICDMEIYTFWVSRLLFGRDVPVIEYKIIVTAIIIWIYQYQIQCHSMWSVLTLDCSTLTLSSCKGEGWCVNVDMV